MEPTSPDKRPLDTRQPHRPTLRVHRSSFLLALGLFVGQQPARSQVPAAADLWRITTATIAAPPALDQGATASFWNPAAAIETRWVAGIQLVQTPDVLGISAMLGAVSYAVSPSLQVNFLAGRTDIGGLSRTTTSPSSELGTIPIYEQLAGLGANLRWGPVHLGLLLRGHDARFDSDRERGITADAGIRVALRPRLALAAATHFFPMDLTGREYTDYYAALQYSVEAPNVWGATSEFAVRYGASYREGSAGGLEHGLGLGWSMNRRFAVDAYLVREVAYGGAALRPSFGVKLKVGRYTIAAARASGLNDVGATYRVGLDLELAR